MRDRPPAAPLGPTVGRMEVLVAGANGNVGRRICRLLVERGQAARALVRSADQAGSLRGLGAAPVVADLEQDVDQAVVDDCDAIVFTAGAGPGSGPERKETVDFGGAVKLIEAADARGVRRYVMVSARGASDPGAGPERLRPYLSAKARADERLIRSRLLYTIVRPGGLTDHPGTGAIEAAPSLGRPGEISRDDVAQTVVACLEERNTIDKTFEVLVGDVPIREALRRL